MYQHLNSSMHHAIYKEIYIICNVACQHLHTTNNNLYKHSPAYITMNKYVTFSIAQFSYLFYTFSLFSLPPKKNNQQLYIQLFVRPKPLVIVPEDVLQSRNAQGNVYRWVEAYRKYGHKLAAVNPISIKSQQR